MVQKLFLVVCYLVLGRVGHRDSDPAGQSPIKEVLGLWIGWFPYEGHSPSCLFSLGVSSPWEGQPP